MANAHTTTKLILVGDGGVGKSSYVKWMRCKEFETKYVPTLGVEVHPIRFLVDTSDGVHEVVFNTWDTAGIEKFGGLRDGYYIQSGCGMVMFDFTSQDSIDHVTKWVGDVRRVCGDIPIVVVGNKMEDVDEEVIEGVCLGVLESLGEEELDVLGVHPISVVGDVDLDVPLMELTREILEA